MFDLVIIMFRELLDLQGRYPLAVFSHLSALYILGLEEEKEIMITTVYGYHNPKLNLYKVFYVKKEVLNLGLVKINLFGGVLKCYDLERTVCDLIRGKKIINLKKKQYLLKKYLRKCNKEKLLGYAQVLDMEKIVVCYLKYLYDFD